MFFKSNIKSKIFLFVILFLLIGTGIGYSNDGNFKSPHRIKDFKEAKRILKKENIYADNQVSFYCGCNYDYKKVVTKKNKLTTRAVVDTSSCGFKSKNNKVAYIEWEHVVPAHAFGNAFSCWRNGDKKCVKKNGKTFKGRKCCELIDKKFIAMEADLYNLQPAIGEINRDRSNYSFAIVEGEPREYGKCDFEISKKTINGKISYKVEPREEIRGDIARTYFYMEDTYKINVISNKNRKLFEAWDKEDPLSKLECDRARKIENIQGNTNKFISKEKCSEASF